MSEVPDMHVHGGAAEPSDEENCDSSGTSSTMEKSSDIVSDMVKAFLATRETLPSGRSNVVLDQVSVEGSGNGVRTSPK